MINRFFPCIMLKEFEKTEKNIINIAMKQNIKSDIGYLTEVQLAEKYLFTLCQFFVVLLSVFCFIFIVFLSVF